MFCAEIDAGVKLTVQEPAESVQLPENVPPPPRSVDQVMVPVTVVAVPLEVSVTVAVQLPAALIAEPTQLTVVTVVRFAADCVWVPVLPLKLVSPA